MYLIHFSVKASVVLPVEFIIIFLKSKMATIFKMAAKCTSSLIDLCDLCDLCAKLYLFCTPRTFFLILKTKNVPFSLTNMDLLSQFE